MKRLIMILFAILLPCFAMSQHDEEWNNFLKQHNFNEYKAQRNAQFQAYKDSINKEFAKHIEQRWQDYQVFVGKRRPSKPEPQQLPVAPHDTVKQQPVQMPINNIIPVPETHPINQDIIEEESIAPMSDTNINHKVFQNVDVNFYMQKVNFDIPESYSQLMLENISEKMVAKFWTSLAEGKFEVCVNQFKQQRKDLHLNDWAVYDMITNLASEVFTRRYAEQTIYTVFMLNQLGLNAKIGRSDNQLIVLIPAKNTIYAVAYALCDNEPYYIFSLYPKEQQVVASVSTYPVAFPKPTQALDMNINEPISFVRQASSVIYTTDFWGDEVPFQVNQNAIDFYGRYPQVDIEIYANAEMSDELKVWSDKQIKPIINDLDEYAAVSVILYYVQTAFDYATDIQQFGYEKPFFCEENFYYSKNDCEDRAILLSYLIRNLVGSKMVLLDYPDHIATAVAFKDDSMATGDYYQVNNLKYYVCDPTYIGANIGESMPQYRKIKADVLMLKGN